MLRTMKERNLKPQILIIEESDLVWENEGGCEEKVSFRQIESICRSPMSKGNPGHLGD